MRLKELPKKSCEWCKKPIERVRFPSGVLEPHKQFIAKRFCSRACLYSHLDANAKRPARLRAEERGHYHARKIKPPTKCQRCGAVEDLEVNHKNGDATDNRKSNLMGLCHSCHQT